ncbi:hypothetical protein HDU93_001829 [Gonapodya sp. JEL0774]|nr:hypothetical protein HDU93_001829 [Gonapodya sp. JEL0774]
MSQSGTSKENGVAFWKPAANADDYNNFTTTVNISATDDNTNRSAALSSIFDVAIVGYGPVGGIMANLLALNGHSVCLVEQSPAIYDKPRAIVLDHEILRILQMMGLGKEVAGMISNHAGTTFVGIDGEPIKHFDPIPPPYPLSWFPTVMFIQPEMEQLIRDRGTSRFTRSNPDRDLSHGIVEVLLEHRVQGIDEDSDGVTLHVKDVTGETRLDKNMLDVVSKTALSAKDRDIVGLPAETKISAHEPADKATFSIRAKFVVGADGGSGNSIIRKSLRIPYDSLDFDEWWIVVDTHLQRPPDPPLPLKSRQYCWPSRPGTFIIGPRTLRRWEIKLLPGEDPSYYSDEVHGLERIKKILSNYIEDLDAVQVWRAAVYRFHALVARKWVSEGGRVFLAGDAGLCAGVRDTANLAWKISSQLRHHPNIHPSASPLLASYQRERAPHVQTIVGHGKNFGLIIGELDEKKALARDIELRTLMREGKVSGYRQAFIPDLDGGCVAEGNSAGGKLFPQPMVRPVGAESSTEPTMMDDLLPIPSKQSWLVVSRDPAAVSSWLDSESDAFLRRVGAQRAVVLTPGSLAPSGEDFVRSGAVAVAEVDGILAAWFDKHNDSTVAVVRPDRCYAYGVARDSEGLNKLVAGVRVWVEGQ